MYPGATAREKADQFMEISSLRQARYFDFRLMRNSTANSLSEIRSFFMPVLSSVPLSTSLTIPVSDDDGKYPT